MASSDLTGAVVIDATTMLGDVVLATRTVSDHELFSDIAGLVGLSFELREPAQHVEVRIRVTSEVRVNVTDLTIFTLKRSIAQST